MDDDGWDVFGDAPETESTETVKTGSDSMRTPVVGGVLASEHPFFTGSKLWPSKSRINATPEQLSFIEGVIRRDFKTFVLDRAVWSALGDQKAIRAMENVALVYAHGTRQELMDAAYVFYGLAQLQLHSPSGWTDVSWALCFMFCGALYAHAVLRVCDIQASSTSSTTAGTQAEGSINRVANRDTHIRSESYTRNNQSAGTGGVRDVPDTVTSSVGDNLDLDTRCEGQVPSSAARDSSGNNNERIQLAQEALEMLDAMIVVSGRLEDGASRWELAYLPEVIGWMVSLLEVVLNPSDAYSDERTDTNTDHCSRHTQARTDSPTHLDTSMDSSTGEGVGRDTLGTPSAGSYKPPIYPGAVTDIPTINCEEFTMTKFYSEYLSAGRPVIVKGHLHHAQWEGLKVLSDLEEMKLRYGHRTVPIEGDTCAHVEEADQATDMKQKGGSGKLKTILFSQFIDDHLKPSQDWCDHQADVQNPAQAGPGAKKQVHTFPHVGYISQHNLFQQIRPMQDLFSVPMYTNLGSLKMVNAWCGTVGTVTALHTDEDNNFLAQIAGYKYIKIFSPADTELLYARAHPRATADNPLNNFSPIDVRDPDLQNHPLYRDARGLHAVLGPGDMLFLPKSWWHFVQSLSTSFSVNFWF